MDTHRKGTLSEVCKYIDLAGEPNETKKEREAFLKLVADAQIAGGPKSAPLLLLFKEDRLLPVLQQGSIVPEQLEAISVLHDAPVLTENHSSEVVADTLLKDSRRELPPGGNFSCMDLIGLKRAGGKPVGVLCILNKKNYLSSRKVAIIRSMAHQCMLLLDAYEELRLRETLDQQAQTEYLPRKFSSIHVDQQMFNVLTGKRQPFPTSLNLEEELRISAESFSGNFENAAVGMALIDENGKWLRVNQRVCEIVGYTEEELHQLTFQDITHPEDLSADLNLLDELVRGERHHYEMEKRYFHKNGSIVYVILSVSIVRDRKGNVLHFVSQIVDITNLKETKQQLEEALSENQAVLDASTQVAIITTDCQGKIRSANTGVETILGHPEDKSIGRNFHQLFLEDETADDPDVSATDNPDFEALVALPKSGVRKAKELYLIHQNGKRVPVLLSITEIIRHGEKTGYLIVATDITTLKLMQSQLDQKNKELEQFAYIAAHDLQEPLRSITSFLSLIERKYSDHLDEKARQYIHYTVDAASRMKMLINDILNFSKADILTHEYVDLNEVIQSIRASFQQEVTHRHARFEIADLPVVWSDPTTMYQLFSNLIGNALKYQKKGNIPEIRIEAMDQGSHWLFSVADNGIGIDRKHYKRVFEVFKRLHNKTEYSGSGIGLATCKKIVTLYGGEIWISPNPRGGTIFSFTFAKKLQPYSN